MPLLRKQLIAFALLSAFAVANSLHATERRFTFTYEATTPPKGTVEIENWVTWKTNEQADQFDFRHEIEFGVTDHFQASIYVVDWTVSNDASHHRSARYEDTAVELIYNLTNPVTDFLGSAIYGEVRLGDRTLDLEGKLILQKNLGPWLIAYNAVLEAIFKGSHLDERTGEMQHVLGVSYEATPQFTVGVEVLEETEWPGWAKPGTSRVWAGPNASFRKGNFYATLTPLVQLTHEKDEPDFQTRLIVGYHF